MNIKLLNEYAKIPTQGSDGAAGWDLYAAIDAPVEIAPHSTEMIGTGFTLELPNGWMACIYARSGLATKKGLRPANCVGIVDPDYRGEYIVALHNDTDICRTVEPGERIAQMVFQQYGVPHSGFTVVKEVSDTARGDGGFGSTGEK
jgi:dUTP pyrophosphatase